MCPHCILIVLLFLNCILLLCFYCLWWAFVSSY